MFTCALCKRQFKTISALHQYLKREHNYKDKIDCTKYNTKFNSF